MLNAAGIGVVLYTGHETTRRDANCIMSCMFLLSPIYIQPTQSGKVTKFGRLACHVLNAN